MATEPSRFKSGSMADLEERLRRSPIKGDAETKPYSTAEISLERLTIDSLVPLSKYVLKDKLEFIEQTRLSLLAHSVDILDLDCGLVWPDGVSGRPVAAPIVEEWDEALLLVDGLHRVWTARSMGSATVTCAVLRRVELPLMTLPASWRDIKIFPSGQSPHRDEKRNYRFSNVAALKTAIPAHAAHITSENCEYFLYRDLQELGSDGVRVGASIDTRGKHL